MALPKVKRRKLDHSLVAKPRRKDVPVDSPQSSSDGPIEEELGASFSGESGPESSLRNGLSEDSMANMFLNSFEDDILGDEMSANEDEDNEDGMANMFLNSFEDDILGDEMSANEDEDNEAGRTEDEGEAEDDLSLNGVDESNSRQRANVLRSRTTKPPRNQHNGVHHDPAYIGELYGSNLFKLQVDELLETVKPKYGKKEAPAENALRTLKSIIEGIPERGAASVPDAVEALYKDSNVKVPFPSPGPPADAKYKLQYARPANINAVGSYPLRTSVRVEEVMVIDLAVTMPSTIFQEKDFLDYRYFYKRAYFLAVIASGIKGSKEHGFQLCFHNLNGNHLQPILVVKSLQGKNDFSSSNCIIHIIPTVAEDAFPYKRLSPDRCCVRPRATDNEEDIPPKHPTSFYNSSLRSDMLVTQYLKVLYAASKDCEAFADACVLGRTWLRQRGFTSKIQTGGFGAFEWAAMTALLLQGGAGKGTPLFSPGYSSYQLFKAGLQFLASRNMSKQPFIIYGDASNLVNRDGAPVFFDGLRGLNILFKMTPWSYQRLRMEARASLAMLGDSAFDQFQSTFILRADSTLYYYDLIVSLPTDAEQVGLSAANPFGPAKTFCSKIYSSLSRGLTDRVRLVDIISPEMASWNIDNDGTAEPSTLQIGFMFDPINFNRSVDHGPPAEKKKEAASFRHFWGEKAELRRFKDGSILESLVWSSKDSDTPIFEQVVSYILQRCANRQVAQQATFSGSQFWRLLPRGKGSNASSLALFQPQMSAFKALEDDIRGLEGLPLVVRSLLGSSPQLRYSSIDILNATAYGASGFADVVLQFEGSGRWPDDLIAIQRTKIAFLLKLGELLEEAKKGIKSRIGLENEHVETLNQAFLDIAYPTGAAFRIRIYNEREQTLLERELKSPALSSAQKEETAMVLAACKRDFVRAPTHTQTLQILCTRFPMLSPTMRLLKRWFASHLLLPHFAPELVELLAVRAFTQPHPWTAPSSPATGFLRTLSFLARWDWRRDPLVVDLHPRSTSGSPSPSSGLPAAGAPDRAAAVAAARTRFAAWRSIDPALNRVVLFAATTADADGAAWTDHARPPRVVAARMTALARAATRAAEERGADVAPAALFVSSLADYDFVLRLDPRFCRGGGGGGGDGQHGGGEGGDGGGGGVGGEERQRRQSLPQGFKNVGTRAFGGMGREGRGYEPVLWFIEELREMYGRAVVLFHDGEATIAGLWNPAAVAERPWRIRLGYSTTPVAAPSGALEGDGVGGAALNTAGVLSEMARLGGRLVRTIEVKRELR